MSDLNNIAERVRGLEKELAEFKGANKSQKFWLTVVAGLFVAWVGVTSLYDIPRLVRNTAEGQASAEIARLLEAAEKDFSDLQAIGEFGVEVRRVLVVNHENEGKENGHYFTMDAGDLAEVIREGMAESGEDHAKILVLNVRTGILQHTVIWPAIRDFHSAGDVHGRYEPYGSTTSNDWRPNDQLVFFVGNG